ncbi:MAG: universal stress protein [bacterium]|nr:universal stress protein [bacterium]
MVVNNYNWVFGYDFSSRSQQLLDIAAAELDRLSGEMTIIHVFNVVPPAGAFTPVSSEVTLIPETNVQEENTVSVTQVHLNAIITKMQKQFKNIKVQTLIREGDPAEEIIAAADEIGANRIVVGNHSKSMIERLLLGSVAEKIVRRASLSVLVIKSDIQSK